MWQCEDCGYEGPRSDFVMFQGEVALCSDEVACKERVRNQRLEEERG